MRLPLLFSILCFILQIDGLGQSTHQDFLYLVHRTDGDTVIIPSGQSIKLIMSYDKVKGDLVRIDNERIVLDVKDREVSFRSDEVLRLKVFGSNQMRVLGILFKIPGSILIAESVALQIATLVITQNGILQIPPIFLFAISGILATTGYVCYAVGDWIQGTTYRTGRTWRIAR